jgi:transcriptional regulator with XRE-family HTH domain
MPITEDDQVGRPSKIETAKGMSGLVGAIIARERAVRGLSIEDLAQRASMSTGLISQLERGIGNPSLGTLVGLANALELPIGAFFEGAASDDELVVHPHSRKRLVLSDHNLTYELLVPNLQGKLAMLHIELPPGFSNEHRPFRHAGEECAYVMKGRLEIHVAERTAELRSGDSVRFASSTPHWYRTFDDSVLVISAMTPPSF